VSDLAHYTKRMLQALDAYWSVYEGRAALAAVEGIAATPGEECPTCGQTGPDTFVRVGDYGGDVWEARCGDEWHDTVSADPRETTDGD